MRAGADACCVCAGLWPRLPFNRHACKLPVDPWSRWVEVEALSKWTTPMAARCRPTWPRSS